MARSASIRVVPVPAALASAEPPRWASSLAGRPGILRVSTRRYRNGQPPPRQGRSRCASVCAPSPTAVKDSRTVTSIRRFVQFFTVDLTERECHASSEATVSLGFSLWLQSWSYRALRW
jgi:hypothetical protein